MSTSFLIWALACQLICFVISLAGLKHKHSEIRNYSTILTALWSMGFLWLMLVIVGYVGQSTTPLLKNDLNFLRFPYIIGIMMTTPVLISFASYKWFKSAIRAIGRL